MPQSQRAALAADIEATLNQAERDALDGRQTETNLRRAAWARVHGASGRAMAHKARSQSADTQLVGSIVKLQRRMDAEMLRFSGVAKRSISNMPERDIRRACTNVWPMLCWQALDGRAVRLTDAMVGFSLLYPLTDDIVDSPSVTQASKRDFLERFGRLINYGDGECADNAQERHIWRAFAIIERDRDRDVYPTAYRIMHELLVAQADSQLQLAGPKHHDKPPPQFADVWEVTVRKGALSILSDAYLVKGHLTRHEASFAAHFGVMTQFLNDLRTIDEDHEEGQYTPFNMVRAQGHNLDGLMDEVFHYYAQTFTCAEHAPVLQATKKSHDFAGVMLIFLSYKLIEGIATHRNHFSENFLQHIEHSSPLPLQLIERMYVQQTRGDNAAASIFPALDAGN